MLIYFSCYYVTEYFTNLMILYMDFFLHPWMRAGTDFIDLSHIVCNATYPRVYEYNAIVTNKHNNT